MRIVKGSVLVLAMTMAAVPAIVIQAAGAAAQQAGAAPKQAPAAAPQEVSKAVKDGGIKVPGWQGKMDESRENAGLTFTDSDYMGLNTHPHPYGIVIAGNDLGTAKQSYLYCAAYGDGRFIVRGFGEPQAPATPPAPGAPPPTGSFQMNGRGGANPVINKAAAVHGSVTQEIAMSVKGDKVSCAINGTEVASYTKAEVVTAGKLTSTDGVYGIRFGHNTDATVTGLAVIK